MSKNPSVGNGEKYECIKRIYQNDILTAQVGNAKSSNFLFQINETIMEDFLLYDLRKILEYQLDVDI